MARESSHPARNQFPSDPMNDSSRTSFARSNFHCSFDSPSARSRFFGCALFLVSCLHAEPSWKAQLTSPLPGPFPKPAPTSLTFQVSWNGTINAGTVRIEFAPPDVAKAGSYIIRSSAASQGAAALLFPYQTNFWSELAPTTLRPRFFHAAETDHRETVTTTVRHSPNRVESQEITQQLKTGVCKQTDQVFEWNPVFDLFSAMLHVRSQKLEVGDPINLVIHPFDTPYLLRVKVLGREIHQGRKTIRLTVGLQKINRNTSELIAYKKLKQDATMWLSDDADRVPVELRAAAFIGDVRATLVGFKKF
jgi:Protein of unknown function (DUF3108)